MYKKYDRLSIIGTVHKFIVLRDDRELCGVMGFFGPSDGKPISSKNLMFMPDNMIRQPEIPKAKPGVIYQGRINRGSRFVGLADGSVQYINIGGVLKFDPELYTPVGH